MFIMQRSAMELHTTPVIPVLRRRLTLRLPQVAQMAGPCCAELEALARAQGRTVQGPPIFAAHGLPQDGHTPFDLDICLPVSGPGAEELPALSCMRTVYCGPLEGLFTQGYQALLDAIAAAGRTPSGQTREVYHAWHGPDSPDNRIELQIGLAP
jgi:hypothetical protein